MVSSVRALVAAALLLLSACSSTTVHTSHYLGVLDTQRQVPQELYRVTIDGESPWYSKAEYASGWVPAEAADLLVQEIKLADGHVHVSPTTTDPKKPRVTPTTTRQFFEIGPHGVSFAPQEGRFVIVMGSDPDYFFQKTAALAGAISGTGPRGGADGRTSLRADLRQKRLEICKARDELPPPPPPPPGGGDGDGGSGGGL